MDWQDAKGLGKVGVGCIAAIAILFAAIAWASSGQHTNWGILIAVLYFDWRLKKTDESINDLRGRLRELQDRSAPPE